MLGKADEYMLKANLPPIFPHFLLKLLAKYSIDFWLTSEDLPDPNNRVRLSPTHGIQLHYTANNTQSHDNLV